MIPLVLLFEVASRGSWRALAWAAWITVALSFVNLYLFEPVEENRTVIVFLAIATVVAAVASGVAVRTRRAYLVAFEDRAARLEVEQDQRARPAVARERARVAREMHDIVGHHVSVIVGLADGGAALATSRAERTAEPLRLIGETGRQALAELRRVLGVLRDDNTDPQPGRGATADVTLAAVDAGVRVRVRDNGRGKPAAPGHGLLGIRERVAMYGVW